MLCERPAVRMVERRAVLATAVAAACGGCCTHRECETPAVGHCAPARIADAADTIEGGEVARGLPCGYPCPVRRVQILLYPHRTPLAKQSETLSDSLKNGEQGHQSLMLRPQKSAQQAAAALSCSEIHTACSRLRFSASPHSAPFTAALSPRARARLELVGEASSLWLPALVRLVSERRECRSNLVALVPVERHLRPVNQQPLAAVAAAPVCVERHEENVRAQDGSLREAAEVAHELDEDCPRTIHRGEGHG